jgi:hypothetical protein
VWSRRSIAIVALDVSTVAASVSNAWSTDETFARTGPPAKTDAALAKKIRPNELADAFVAASAAAARATSTTSAASRNDRFVLVINVGKVDVRRVGRSILMRLLNEIKAQVIAPGPSNDVRGFA